MKISVVIIKVGALEIIPKTLELLHELKIWGRVDYARAYEYTEEGTEYATTQFPTIFSRYLMHEISIMIMIPIYYNWAASWISSQDKRSPFKSKEKPEFWMLIFKVGIYFLLTWKFDTLARFTPTHQFLMFLLFSILFPLIRSCMEIYSLKRLQPFLLQRIWIYLCIICDFMIPGFRIISF